MSEAPFADPCSAVADRADRRGVPGSFTAAVRFFYEWRTGRSWDAVDLRPAVARLHCPVLLVHGDADDQTTPRHSRALFEACGSPRKRMWLVPGGRHTWLHTADLAGYRARLAELWP